MLGLESCAINHNKLLNSMLTWFANNIMEVSLKSFMKPPILKVTSLWIILCKVVNECVGFLVWWL